MLKWHRSSHYSTMFCWETIDPGINVDATNNHPPQTLADQVCPPWNQHKLMILVPPAGQWVLPHHNGQRTVTKHKVGLASEFLRTKPEWESMRDAWKRPYRESDLAFTCQGRDTWSLGAYPWSLAPECCGQHGGNSVDWTCTEACPVELGSEELKAFTSSLSQLVLHC